MKLTDIFVRRPVLAIVVNLVIIIAGLQAIRSLNVRQYPKLESASVTVRTAYVSANAELVRGFITTPLERSIAAADGIDFIESQSQQVKLPCDSDLHRVDDLARAITGFGLARLRGLGAKRSGARASHRALTGNSRGDFLVFWSTGCFRRFNHAPPVGRHFRYVQFHCDADDFASID